jgi:hypothetical protein
MCYRCAMELLCNRCTIASQSLSCHCAITELSLCYCRASTARALRNRSTIAALSLRYSTLTLRPNQRTHSLPLHHHHNCRQTIRQHNKHNTKHQHQHQHQHKQLAAQQQFQLGVTAVAKVQKRRHKQRLLPVECAHRAHVGHAQLPYEGRRAMHAAAAWRHVSTTQIEVLLKVLLLFLP